MRVNGRTMVAAVGLALLAPMGLIACGSDGGSSSSGGSSGSSGGSSDLCDSAQELQDANVATDPTSLKQEDFEKFEDIVAELQDKAPAEIKADLDTFAEGFAKVKAIFAKYDYDAQKLTAAAATDTALQQQLQSLSGEEFTAASNRIDQYFQDTCGIGGADALPALPAPAVHDVGRRSARAPGGGARAVVAGRPAQRDGAQQLHALGDAQRGPQPVLALEDAEEQRAQTPALGGEQERHHRERRRRPSSTAPARRRARCPGPRPACPARRSGRRRRRDRPAAAR